MKTVSAHYKTGNYTIPVKLEHEHPHRKLAERLQAFIDSLASGQNYFKWMAISMIVQSVLITPLVSAVIMYNGNWMPLWFAATASMYAVFIPALSGQHVKWIKLVFLINCFVSMMIILLAFVHAMVV